MYLERYKLDLKLAHIMLQIDSEYQPQIGKGLYTAFLDYPPEPGIFLEKQTKLSVTSQYSMEWSAQINDKLSAPEHIGEWVCRIVIKNDDYLSLVSDFLKMQGNPPFKVQPKASMQREPRDIKLVTMLGFYRQNSEVLSKEIKTHEKEADSDSKNLSSII